MWVDVGIVVGWRLGLAQRVGGVARTAYIPRADAREADTRYRDQHSVIWHRETELLRQCAMLVAAAEGLAGDCK
jgi:hypothetical protein